MGRRDIGVDVRVKGHPTLRRDAPYQISGQIREQERDQNDIGGALDSDRRPVLRARWVPAGMPGGTRPQKIHALRHPSVGAASYPAGGLPGSHP